MKPHHDGGLAEGDHQVLPIAQRLRYLEFNDHCITLKRDKRVRSQGGFSACAENPERAHLPQVHTKQLKKISSSEKSLNTLREVDHTLNAPPFLMFFHSPKKRRQTHLVGLAQDLKISNQQLPTCWHRKCHAQNDTSVPTSQARLFPRILGTSSRGQNESTSQKTLLQYVVLSFV